jgi:hypothetical protein
MVSNSVKALKCQYRAKPERERVETRRHPSRTDEGIVQTTKSLKTCSESYSGKLSCGSLVRDQLVTLNTLNHVEVPP